MEKMDSLFRVGNGAQKSEAMILFLMEAGP